jgi:hypothetical protein
MYVWCVDRFPVRPLSFNSHDVGEEDNYFLDMDAPPHHHMPPQVSATITNTA